MKTLEELNMQIIEQADVLKEYKKQSACNRVTRISLKTIG